MQFGEALARLLWLIRHYDPAFGALLLSKYDVKDGFYRIPLAASDAPMLAVILPAYAGEEPMVAIPLSLTMGWTESPPTFCAVTETVADLANRAAYRHQVPPHRLERLCEAHDRWNSPPAIREAPEPTPPAARAARAQAPTDEPRPSTPSRGHPWRPSLASTPERAAPEPEDQPLARLRPLPPPPPETSNRALSRPVKHVDVFVDDFLALSQGSKRAATNLRRTVLHAVDQVFAMPCEGDPRPEAVSTKKLEAGDGSWDTRKLVLGWEIDAVKGTIELPPHRTERLLQIFDHLRHKTRVSRRVWEKYLGELRFMSMGIQGSLGLFGALQLGLQQHLKNEKHNSYAVSIFFLSN
jgi:hypothetical protein